MRDLSWIRKQGKIVDREKKKMRQRVHLPLEKKLEWFAEIYETFEQRLDDTVGVFGDRQLAEMIELEKKVRSLNVLTKQI